MSKSVLIPLSVSGYDNRTKVANFINASADVENGEIFQRGSLSSAADKSEVYETATAATGSLEGLWMAYNPEDVVVETANGNQYKVGDMDPRNFVNVEGKVFAGFKPQPDDRILISTDGFTGAKGVSDTHGNATDAQKKLVWGASATADALSFILEKVSYISIAKGFGSQRVTAYQMRCVSN